MIFTLVPHEYTLTVWPEVAEMLQKAAKTTGGRFDKMNILDELMARTIELWIIYEDNTPVAAITTRVVWYKEFKALSIDWVGGTQMKDWLDEVMSTLKKYAQDNGCTRLEGRGRAGWKRVLSRYGWKPDYVSYELELGDE